MSPLLTIPFLRIAVEGERWSSGGMELGRDGARAVGANDAEVIGHRASAAGRAQRGTRSSTTIAKFRSTDTVTVEVRLILNEGRLSDDASAVLR
jgi:hypothetical protein